jgi:hypothetical protein
MPDTAANDEEGLIDPLTTRVAVPMDSVMDKVVSRYPGARETASSFSRHMRKKDGKMRIEERQARHGGRMPDWRLILKMLRLHTHRATWNTPGNSRTIWVAEGIVDSLLHEPDHTIWDIGARTECVLELATGDVDVDAAGRRLVRLVLSGSDQAMEAAKAEVSALSFSLPIRLAGAKVRPPVEHSIGTPTRTTRTTPWSSSQREKRPSNILTYNCLTRFEDIPRPNEWTTRSLEAYVMRIVRAKHPSHVVSELYGPGVDARHDAVSLLHRILSADDTRSSLSVRAIKLALQYIVDVGPACRPQARAMVHLATAARLPLDTTVYNILLVGNARTHNLESFRDVLRLMTMRGLAPNFVTWSYFLSMIEDAGAKKHVCRAMGDLDLLHGLQGRRALAHEFVFFDLEQERGRWSGVNAFIERQNARYGDRWLTPATADRVLNELGRLGKFRACVEFLDIILSRQRCSVATLNILLNHATQNRSTALAIIALHRAQRAGVSLDKASYNELFKLFRLLHKPNCMSAVWSVACFKGHTTFRMRNHVSKIYRDYPALLIPGSPLPDPVFHLHAKPEPMYHLWRDLPTLHHVDMVPELTEAWEARAAQNAEAGLRDSLEAGPSESPESESHDESHEAGQNEARHTPNRPANLGPTISALYRTLWPRQDWNLARPLYALLAEADAADRVLEARGKARRERAQRPAASSGAVDEWNDVLTNLDRLPTPGNPLLLRPKSNAPGSSSVVADLSPTIYSRTYGVTETETTLPDPEDGTSGNP